MSILSATFEIQFPEPFLVRTSVEFDLSRWTLDPNDFTFRASVDGYDVEIRLNLFQGVGKKLAPHDFLVIDCTRATVMVTGEELQPPPEIVADSGGQLSFGPLMEYLSDRKPHYLSAAQKVFSRLFSFFRYQKRHPHLTNAPDLVRHAFLKATWTGNDGELVWNRQNEFIIPGSRATTLYGKWGVSPYDRADRADLETYLQSPPTVSLAEELLAESFDAIAEKDIRRAVLYLAFACELSLKERLFSAQSVAGDAIEYLESKRSFRVSVPELLDATIHALGKNFPEKSLISQLFSCRDRIAHHGKAEFKKSKTFAPLDDQTLLNWWNAVSNLFRWLHA